MTNRDIRNKYEVGLERSAIMFTLEVCEWVIRMSKRGLSIPQIVGKSNGVLSVAQVKRTLRERKRESKDDHQESK